MTSDFAGALARQVLAAVNGISLLGPKEGVVWRGQADARWRLQSKASRLKFSADDVARHEAQMLEEARRIGIDDAQHMGDWEILARLRHHGAATRLIDCTTDPFIALWFLCDDDEADDEGNLRDRDGLLLALQRNQFSPIARPYASDTYAAMLDKDPAPLIYSTPPIDPRIAAQRGVFVLHSHPLDITESPESELGAVDAPTKAWTEDYAKHLEHLCGTGETAAKRGRPRAKFPGALGVVVPPAVKPVLLEMLGLNFGFSRSTIFPDFAGIAQVYAANRGGLG